MGHHQQPSKAGETQTGRDRGRWLAAVQDTLLILRSPSPAFLEMDSKRGEREREIATDKASHRRAAVLREGCDPQPVSGDLHQLGDNDRVHCSLCFFTLPALGMGSDIISLPSSLPPLLPYVSISSSLGLKLSL